MGWFTKALKKAWSWVRGRIVRPAQDTLAAELRDNLSRIDEAVNGAVLKWAGQVGGAPLAVFVSVAVDALGLSAAANRFIGGLLNRLGAGGSRAASLRTAAGRQAAALEELVPVLTAIREEASKA